MARSRELMPGGEGSRQIGPLHRGRGAVRIGSRRHFGGAERASVSGNPLHRPRAQRPLTGFSRSSTSRPDAGLLISEESPLRSGDLSWGLRIGVQCLTVPWVDHDAAVRSEGALRPHFLSDPLGHLARYHPTPEGRPTSGGGR